MSFAFFVGHVACRVFNDGSDMAHGCVHPNVGPGGSQRIDVHDALGVGPAKG